MPAKSGILRSAPLLFWRAVTPFFRFLPALFYTVLARFLFVSRGHYQKDYVVWLIIMLVFLSWAWVRQQNQSPHYSNELLLLCIIILFSYWTIGNHGLIYVEKPGFAIIPRFISAGIGISAIMILISQRWMLMSKQTTHVAILLCIALSLIARVVALAASPNPHIDVLSYQELASQYLLSGENPYTGLYPELYAGKYGYVPAYNYWPGVLYWMTPFTFFHDVRLSLVIAEALTALGIYQLAKHLGHEKRECLLYPLTFLSFPVGLFVIEQSWNEPIFIAGITLFLWGVIKQHWISSGLVLGYVLATKQYSAFFGVIAMLWLARAYGLWIVAKVSGIAIVTLVVLLSPFLWLDHSQFIEHTVHGLLLQKPRLDALTLSALLTNWFGLTMSPTVSLWVYAATLLAISAMLILRKNITWRDLPYALLLMYLVIFLFGKQAFCNYYYLVAFFAVTVMMIVGKFQLPQYIQCIIDPP